MENFYKELGSFISRPCDCLPAEAHVSTQAAASLGAEQSIYFHIGIIVLLGRILFYIQRVTYTTAAIPGSWVSLPHPCTALRGEMPAKRNLSRAREAYAEQAFPLFFSVLYSNKERLGSDSLIIKIGYA